jgi:DNA-binding response OmpR family regulator
MQNILLLEDDYELNQTLCYALRKDNYHVETAFSVKEAKEAFAGSAPDLLLLDVNLPDGEGFAFCRWAKERKALPVIFLTARDLEEDALKGYDLGAEDYVTKPFSMKILLKKIHVILKRTAEREVGIFNDGYLFIDLNRVKVLLDGKECAVTPTEFRLLKELIINKGQLLTYSVLLERLWDGGGQFVDKHALAVNINRLRRKIEDEDHRYISNVYGMGYQWIGR